MNEICKEMIRSGEYSLLTVKEGTVCVKLNERGIRPMLDIYKNGEMANADVYDKIIGRASAMLLALGKAKRVFAFVMSKPALEVLTENGIEVSYDTLCDNIINRQGNGLCPMEEVVKNLTNISDAPNVISAKLDSLIFA